MIGAAEIMAAVNAACDKVLGPEPSPEGEKALDREKRDAEIVRRVRDGEGNKVICYDLNVSPSTVSRIATAAGISRKPGRKPPGWRPEQ